MPPTQMPAQSPWRGPVVVAGALTLDVLVPVPAEVVEDARTRVEEIRHAPGGPAAIAAVTLARLGVDTTLVVPRGRDPEGDMALGALATVPRLTVRAVPVSVSTQASVVLSCRARGTRTILSRIDDLTAADEDAMVAQVRSLGFAVLHVDATRPALARRLINVAAERGARVSLDAGHLRREDLLTLLPGVTLVAADQGSTRALHPDPVRAIQHMHERGVEIAVSTLGPGGAMVSSGGGVTRVPALAVPVTDTTGAGDVFHGALVAYLLAGHAPVAAVRRACAAAALTLDHLGGFPEHLTREAVDQLADAAPHRVPGETPSP